MSTSPDYYANYYASLLYGTREGYRGSAIVKGEKDTSERHEQGNGARGWDSKGSLDAGAETGWVELVTEGVPGGGLHRSQQIFTRLFSSMIVMWEALGVCRCF